MEIFYFDGSKIVVSDSLENLPRHHHVWIRFPDKSAEKIEEISKYTSVPEDEFKDFFNYEERSRLEQGRFLELIYQTPFKEGDEITTTPVNFFIVRNLFITVERENIPVIDKIAALMKKNKLRFLFKKSIGEFLYYFIDKINDDFLLSIDRITNLTDVLESKHDNVSNEQLMKLYQFNVTLTHFNQAILANLEVLAGLRKSYFKKFTKEDLELFAELYHSKLQILDTEKIQREVITTLFNFQTIVATHKLNNLMKRLTSVAVLFVVPTLIAGIFGMNVQVPFANSPYGFFIVMGIIIFCVALLFLVLSKLEMW